MAEQKIFPQQIDTTGSTTGQVLFSNGTNAYWGSGGFTGSNGYTGSVGIGYTGSNGYFGSVGYSGSIGNPGYTGSQGFWGSNGYFGSVGYSGSKGDSGYSGSKGTDGVIGYWGSVGYTGSIGAGYTGSTGTTAILYTSTTAPASPVAGTFWYKTDEATLYVYYNDGDSNQWVGVTAAGSTGYTGSSGGGGGGNGYTGSIGYSGSSGSASLTSVRQQFTGDGSTTTFAVAGGYTPNAISVFVNGVLLRNGTEVTVTNGSTVVFAIAPLSGALIDVIGTVPTTYSSITPVGYSVQFNGTSQYMTVPNNAAFTFGTGDFTVECWTYLTSTGVNASIFSKRASASIYGFTFGTDSGNHFTAGIPNAAGNAWVQLLASSITFSANVWYHFACVRASGTVILYVNGIPVASGAASNSIYDDGTAAVIGCTGSVTPGAYFPGYVSNLRIVKGVAVYTGPFTPAGPLAAVQSATATQSAITGTQTSLLTCNGPTIIDGSTNAFTITNNGSAPVSTAIVPTFTNVTINNPSLSTYQAAYLVVAGGGGGGFPAGGGGGAGGLLTNSTLLSIGTTYTITVGAGGNGGLVSGGVIPTIGTNSVMSGAGLTTITAVGGGGGGSGGGSTGIGSSGGSGGGAGNNGSAASGSAGTSGQGFAGGNNSGSSPYPSGGGGGSGAAGSNGSGSASGAGGAGTVSSITGSSVTYAGGGGGAGTSQGSSAGAGGAGGGGAGGGAGTAGTTNTGGGGGGASNAAAYNGGAGGSGVVIIAVPYANYTGTTTGSPTVTTVTSFSGTYKILTFTASGSYTA
jgi:hypothetical protein